MEKQANIQNYSFYDTYTVSDKGDNWSRVVSKMVQLAGRYCERFASDIYYDIDSFTGHIRDKVDFDRYLFFRESGVTALSPVDIAAIEDTDYIQAWHLTYNAETEEQELTRVSINFEKRYW
jgi:hypothetical protein